MSTLSINRSFPLAAYGSCQSNGIVDVDRSKLDTPKENDASITNCNQSNKDKDDPSIAKDNSERDKQDETSELKDSLGASIDVDEALELSGGYGRFQYIIGIFIVYFVFTFAYQHLFTYFTGHDPAWTCVHKNSSGFCRKNFGVHIQTEDRRFSQRCKLNRSEWTYTTHKKYSHVTEFDLVCGKTGMAAVVNGIYHIGGGIGVFFTGAIADRYGRKFTLLVMLSLFIVADIASSFSVNVIQLILTRAIYGAAASSCYAIAFVYLSEFIPPKYRAIMGNVFAMGFNMAEFVIDIVAYYCRYWRRLQLYSAFPCVIALLLLLISPKSPRWLFANKKKSEAEKVLKKIGKINRHPIPSINLKSLEIKITKEKYTYLDLLRNRKVFFSTVAQSLIWMTMSLLFYAISYESSNLGGSMYQAFALSALAEIPSKLVATWTLDRFGRKKTVLTFLFTAGVFCGLTTLIPENFEYRYAVRITLLMFGKFSIDMVVLGIYMWSFEIFPTVLRLQGCGICVIFERLGSSMSPFLTSVLHQFNPRLPYLVMMIFAFSSAAAGIILPETKDLPTRETYEDFFLTPSKNKYFLESKDHEGYQDIDENKV